MESYEEYLQNELEKAKRELSEVSGSLGPNYRYSTIKTLSHLYDALQQSFARCSEEYLELEHRKQASVEEARAEKAEALEAHRRECDADVERVRAKNESLLESLVAEKGARLDELQSEKSRLEEELESVSAQYRELVALIERDQAQYDDKLADLHEETSDQLRESEQQFIAEIAGAYSALQKRIESMVHGNEAGGGEGEGEEAPEGEGEETDSEFREKIQAEYQRRQTLLSGIEESSASRLASILDLRRQKVAILKRDAALLVEKAASQQKARLQEAEEAYESGSSELQDAYDAELKLIERRETEAVEQASQEIRGQCAAVAAEFEEKQRLLGTVREETEARKQAFEQLVAELSTDVPRSTVPTDARSRFVYCRVRPMTQMDVEQGDYEECIVSHFAQDVGLVINPHFAPEHYEFDGVFLQQSTLKDVFETVKPHLLNIFNMPCLTLLSSGPQLGGKSYLMEGREQDGLLYSTLKALFKVPKKIKTCNFTFSISIMEIYRNNVFDLQAVATSENNDVINFLTRVDVERSDQGFAVLKGLKENEISSFEDFLEMLENAFHRREEATEGMKRHASHSHLIVHVTATKIDRKSGAVSHHHLNFIELASCDAVPADEQEKKDLDESSWIQHSLSVLSQALVDKSSFEKDCLSFFLKEDLLKPKGVVLFYQSIAPVHGAIKSSRPALAFAAGMRVRDLEFNARAIATSKA